VGKDAEASWAQITELIRSSQELQQKAMAAQQAAAISLDRAHKEMMTMIRAERAAKDAANASKKVAEEEVKVANAAKEEAERKLKECIQPVATPTFEEVRAAMRKVQYREDLFHFAVAGVGQGGKSSLINAFRGLRNKDIGSARTGVTETTMAITRYPDPNAAVLQRPRTLRL
jgi:tRNA U34 5-carboxymethylaminomethyl modifying GTPase MnmE/TrmE